MHHSFWADTIKGSSLFHVGSRVRSSLPAMR
jgi:hypothetical protein